MNVADVKEIENTIDGLKSHLFDGCINLDKLFVPALEDLLEENKKLIESLQMIQDYTKERKEITIGMDDLFDYCTEILNEVDLPKAIETNESPSP